MQEIGLGTILLNNSIGNYGLALLFLVAVFLIIKIFDKFLLEEMNLFVGRFSRSFSVLLKKMVKKRIYPLLYFLALYLAFRELETSTQIDNFINLTLMILTVIFAVLAALDIITYGLKKYWAKKQRSEEQQKVLTISLFLVKIIVWIIAFLFILDNLDIQIAGLITGLGIGGVAIAFAAQNILTDLFNYFTIFFDKPFDIGDFIITGEYRGTIEHIGVKSTRIRSLSGEQLIISNTDLVNSRINNYKRMKQRRINFSFGLTYDAPLEKLKKVPGIVEEIIRSLDKTEFDRAHFAEYTASSLLFQVVYYVKDSDYKVYMEIQQQINFSLKEKLEELGVSFAFPTQTIHFGGQRQSDSNSESIQNISSELNQNKVNEDKIN
ncbi:small-conductance mechanosensitive channel [Halanaerobium saccharolyticum]|uniref:Small-conductance mechanosensitive channel n=1 Tax=Halanaerobium saccharolyticum TaxID=43595 RepID=A0A4R7Z4B6_9FIRM|nr:mechanosensitive ion channel family protein [Halanaerobium saccharolyticum]RAK08959.1 small-conductance mechanosensitive channel [Halanaerobium saccharolyticum]TDW02647.1 small-conductance mechanosensitive channel [Halanaerobium saccharolyticum]TDX60722.1 small-conductance mechanosensitive channel [Halanaerobium saccharolyticum]